MAEGRTDGGFQPLLPYLETLREPNKPIRRNYLHEHLLEPKTLNKLNGTAKANSVLFLMKAAAIGQRKGV